jgi:hypothetical protein
MSIAFWIPLLLLASLKLKLHFGIIVSDRQAIVSLPLFDENMKPKSLFCRVDEHAKLS